MIHAPHGVVAGDVSLLIDDVFFVLLRLRTFADAQLALGFSQPWSPFTHLSS